MPDPIRVLIVDDHEVFREALAAALHQHFAVIGHCATARECIEKLASEAADVVVLDYGLAVERGSAVVEWTHGHQYPGRILILTAGIASADAVWLIQHGVRGIISKERSLDDVVQAIRRVADGGNWLEESLLPAVMAAVAVEAPALRTTPLFTDRERKTLRLLVEGCSNKEIASRLGASEAAVKATIQKLFDKTGVRSRGHLMRLALQDYQNELPR